MKYENTVACRARYGDVLGNIFGDWEILMDDSQDDYQGSVKIIAKKDGRYAFCEYWYGSCSGCDDWEARGLNSAAIEMEMREEVLWLDDREQLQNWYNLLLAEYRKEDSHGWWSNSTCNRLRVIAEELSLPFEENREEQ